MMVSPPGDLKMRSLGAPGSRSREGACGRVHARLVRLLLSAVTVALTLSAYAFPRVKGVRLSAEGCAQDESLKQCETVDEVRVQLRWIRSAQFAGFYAAEAKQYYADECIHVTLVPRAKHSTVTPEEPVLLGLQDFGTPFMASNLMNAESGNGRLVTLAQVFRRPGLINVINPWTQPNISSFEDLAGRKTTIASSPDDVKLLVFASALNLTLCGPVFDIPCDGSEDIRVIFKSLGATSNLMLDPSDENFAEVASFTIYNQYNGLLRMKKDDGSLFQPDEIRFLEDPKQFQGLQFMEDGIGVNAPWLDLEGSTDLAKRFLRATLKGWIHCRDNPTSCVNIMLQDDEDHQTHITFMLKEINKMIWPSPDGIGNINEKEHNDVYRAMFEFSAVSRLYSADDFTNGSIIASVLSELIKEGYDVHGWHYEYGDLRTQLTYCLDRSDRVVLCEGTLRCPPGSMPPTDGQFLSTDDCIVCPVGMTSGGGLELCTACADGLHAPEEGMSKCVKKTNYWWMWVLLAGLVIAHLCAGAWLWYQNYKLASHVNAICKAQKEDLDSPLTKAIQLLDDISQGKTLNRKLLRERAEVIKATLLNSNNILTPDLNKQVDDSKFSKDIKQFLLQSAGTVERQKKLSASLGLSVFEIDEDRADFRDMLTNDSVLYGAMQSVGTTFDLDVLSAELHCPGRILTTSAMALLHKFGILHDLGISMQKMLSFVAAIEAGYKDNPYHNSAHAADVTSRLGALLFTSGVAYSLMKDPQGKIMLLASIVAAIIHDFEHPGLSNNCVVNLKMQPAITYNDQAVLENDALCKALSLAGDNGFNLWEKLPRQLQQVLRTTVIQLVLSTDMSKHFEIMTAFRSKIDVRNSSGGFDVSLLDLPQKMLVLQLALMVADIGHCALPRDAHIRWVDRLQREFFKQGDVEVANGLPVSPLMDRNKPGPLKGGNQVGFFKFIVKPMVDTWVEMFPSSKPLQDNLNSNYLFWEHNFDSCPEVPDTPFLHAGKSVSALHSTSTKSFHRLVGNGIQQQEMVPISLPV